jgi:hypothetical protein
VRRDTVAEQPDLHLGHPLVTVQGCLLRPPALPDLVQQPLQSLGADEVGRNQLMAGIDRQAVIDDVQQGR